MRALAKLIEKVKHMLFGNPLMGAGKGGPSPAPTPAPTPTPSPTPTPTPTPTPSPTPTPTPTPAPVGNLKLPANKTEAEAMLAARVSGDVINCKHAGYTASSGWALNVIANGTDNANLITNPAEPVRVRIVDQANVNLELTLSGGSGDAVAGNVTESVQLNDTVYIQNSSGIAITGSNIGQGYCSIRIISSTDITLAYNNIYGARDDLIKMYSGVQRLKIVQNKFRDAITASRVWSKYDGSPPIVSPNDPGGGYGMSFDPNHCDGFQGFAGVINHLIFEDNDLRGYFQGLFLTNSLGGSQSYISVKRNTFQCAMRNALILDTANHVEVSDNVFLDHPDAYFGAGVNIGIGPAGGTGLIRGGRNTIPAGSSVDVGASGVDLASATINGATVTAPTAPSFTDTLNTVADLNIPRARPDYTDYAGGLVVVVDPILTYSGTSVGSWFNIIPKEVKGYSNGCEAGYRFRVKRGGTVVNGPFTGMTGANYHATVAGSYTGELDVGNGIWRPTSALVVS